MKKATIISPISFLFLFFMLNLSVHSQTMVQWYTSMGYFNVQLREDLVPNTAQNFIDLTNNKFYDTLQFHRVISGFMIQDGCPLGDGSGGPGYSFDDEFHPLLNHNEAGILSMANSGPNTNGSQYFITVAPTTWLNNLHAVFGKVIDGLDVVIAISEVATDANDHPLVDVVIDSIRVIPMGTKSLALTSPVQGDILLANRAQSITWTSQFVSDVNIEFSMDGGTTWQLVADSISCNAKSFAWEMPDSLATNCKVRISDANDATLSDMSGVFTLGKLDLLTPQYGTYMGGHELEITWTSEAIPYIGLAHQDTVGGEWTTFVDSIPAGNNSYLWTIPESDSKKNKVKAFVSHTPLASDETSGYFKICTLKITHPVGGTQLVYDSVCNIQWSSANISQLTIEFSSDNQHTWAEIVPEIYAWDSTYAWTVPNTISDSCFIKAYYKGKPELFKITEEPFSIGWQISIDEAIMQEPRFTISPNPARDALNIKFENTNKVKQLCISIYEMNGKLLDQNMLENQPLETIYDISNLKSGVYFIELKSHCGTETQKFIIKE